MFVIISICNVKISVVNDDFVCLQVYVVCMGNNKLALSIKKT